MGARERSDEDKISQNGRSERFLSDGTICGLIGEAEAEVAAGSGLWCTEVAVEAVVLLTTTAADDTQEDKTAEERHTKGLE